MRSIQQIILLTFIFNLYACEMAPVHNQVEVDQTYEDVYEEPTRTLIIGGEEIKNLKSNDFVSWKCSDYTYGGKTLVEVGRISHEYFKQKMGDYKTNGEYKALDDDEKKEANEVIDQLIKTFSGFVLYDGSNEGNIALYQRRGINQRWDWGPEGKYSFIIKPDGTGLYYDFTTAEDGKKSKADDIYKCRK